MIGYCFSLAIATSIALVTISLDSNLQAWRAVNDSVMGGVSMGRMVKAEDTLRFDGELSLENNGGFASVRRQVGFLLADKQPGLFALDIRSIEFVSPEDPGSRH